MKRLGIGILLLSLLPANAFPLTLDEGLRIITEKGRDVRIAGAEEEQSRESVSLARAPLLPRVDAFASHTDLTYLPEALFGGNAVPLSQKDFVTYGFTATQTIYDFGKSYSTLQASKYGLRSKEADTVRVRNNAALEFIVAYLDLLEAEKILQVSREEVERLELHLKDTQALYAEGMITRNDVLQAQVTLSDAQQRFLTAENARDVMVSRVNSLLLRPLDAEVKAEEVGVSLQEPIGFPEARALAEAERPEVKETEAAIAAKEAELSAVRAEYLPSVFVSGGYRRDENQYMVHDDNWSITAGVNINLFGGGATAAKAGRARAEILALRLTKEKLLDTIRLEVKSAHLDLQSARKKLEVAEIAVSQAAENLRLQRLRYQEGVGTATDVLDAVTLKTRADTNYWTGVYGIQRAEARFQYSLGRDLVAAYAQAPKESAVPTQQESGELPAGEPAKQ